MSTQNTETPKKFVREVERLFRIKFRYDMAASEDNAKAPIWYGEEFDSLKNPWPRDGWIWLNPPFANLGKWVNKCDLEANLGSKIVSIWPLSSDLNQKAAWTHSCVNVLHGRVWPLVRGCMLCVWDSDRPVYIHGLDWERKKGKLTVEWI